MTNTVPSRTSTTAPTPTTLNGSAAGDIFNTFVSKFLYGSWLVLEHAELDSQRSNAVISATSSVTAINDPSFGTDGPIRHRTVVFHDRTLWLHRYSPDLLRL